MHYTVHAELSVMLCNMPAGSGDRVVMRSKRCRSKSSVIPTQNIISAGFHRRGTKPLWLLFVVLRLRQNYFYFFFFFLQLHPLIQNFFLHPLTLFCISATRSFCFQSMPALLA